MPRIGSSAIAVAGVLALSASSFAGVAGATPTSVATHNGPQGGPQGPKAASVSVQAVTAISSAQIIANAGQWYIKANDPPYNQAGYWQGPTDYAGDGRGDAPRPGGSPPAWREDCSGFLAHAWGEADSGGGFTTFTMPAYSTPVAWSDLQPGDAILFNSVTVPGFGVVDHVGLFMGWDDQAHTTYSVMDESNPGSGTVLQNDVTLDNTFWGYGQPVRYNGFVSSGQATVGASSPAPAGGYWLAGSDGQTYAFDAPFAGSAGGLTKPLVGMAATPDRGGYYEVASDGGIFAFGDARFAGSTGNERLNQPIVGMATDPATGGYWMVASDGGIFSFNAPFLGSEGGQHLNKPVVGMAATPDGGGYYLVASDGGIFAFGDARFAGSTGNERLNQPIVGMATDPATEGYWMVASDGGIFSFNAPFVGSEGATKLTRPIIAMAPDASGLGYWMVASDGGIFALGDAPFHGSTGGVPLSAPIVGMARGPG